VKTDKGQFDEVLRRMLDKEPQKTSEIRAEKKEKKPKPSQR
jgi:hypothetical protein